ncbi:unnamed protein product [Trifolium pratense]|uniref:Uncharacterized protein n=1 Tax=Trifolium pratense TaxID=57577 RepID=A0ACB0IEX0_TRIPR|nr:unnamed protein product [Trifolium pratense]
MKQYYSRSEKRMKCDWANLEALPLSLILDKLKEHVEHVWFSAVCKNWQSIAKLNHQNHEFKPNTLPMLMLPSNSVWKQANTFSFIEMKQYPFRYQLCHNNPTVSVCGSSHGWLALLDVSKSVITLMNPFKDTPRIILPPLNSVNKVTLSADPIANPDDCLVVAIYDGGGGNLAFIRRGQTVWTYVDTSKSSFIDVIFYKGMLFALNIRDKIVSFDIHCLNDSSDKVRTITPNVVLEEKIGKCYGGDKYLVKSLKEELWMVRRCNRRLSRFHVCKLKLNVKSGKLEQMVKLTSLEDDILFLGAGDSVSTSRSYFSNSLLRDSIYFADGFKIYHVKTETAKHHCLYQKSPFWVMPHL